tara:strand:+ start:374 stop:850 length:477 start_codon:yes stop_codon:yes gene_type:complete
VIKKNDVVTMGFSLKNSAGEELDSADAKEPLNYLHGAKNIVPGLEEAINGLAVGDKKDVTISPDKGYGEDDPGLRLKIPRSNFPPKADIKPEMQFASEMDGHKQIFTVISVEDDEINVDGNHPLAGQTLHFSIEILGVRDATEEELSHGHVHDGTHHH